MSAPSKLSDTPSTLSTTDSERLDEALNSNLDQDVSHTLAELSKKLQKEMPMVVGEGDNLRLRRTDRRLQWGITKRNGVFTMALLVEKGNSRALAKADKLKEEHGAHVSVGVTGRAYSSRAAPKESERERPLRPGLSISHYGGWPGSLGCLVTVRGQPGLLSASHVLSMNNRAKVWEEGRDDQEKEWVIQPGRGDAAGLAGDRVGELLNYTLLAHYSGDPINPANTLDVGLSSVDNDRNFDDTNWVRDPSRDQRMAIRWVLPAAELFAHLGEEVYKVGRSGFSVGVLEFTNVQRYPIMLPDGKLYVYDDIACVASVGEKPFSEPGDSGAMVYLKKGRFGQAIGLIIGGSKRFTYISPLSACLKAVAAEPVGVVPPEPD